MTLRAQVYLTREGDRDFLNVRPDGGAFVKFEVTAVSLARLAMEASARLWADASETHFQGLK